MKKLITLVIFSVFVSMVMVACNSNLTKEVDQLHDRVKTYGKLIRWSAFDDASGYIKLRNGGSVSINSAILDETRVTRYKIASIVLTEEQDQAAVVAVISYYHERVNDVHDIRDEQMWWKDEESGSWYLDGNLPNFTP